MTKYNIIRFCAFVTLFFASPVWLQAVDTSDINVRGDLSVNGSNVVTVGSFQSSNAVQQAQITVNALGVVSNASTIQIILNTQAVQQAEIDVNIFDLMDLSDSNLTQQAEINSAVASNLSQQITLDAQAVSNITQQLEILANLASNLTQQITIDANALATTDNAASNLTQQSEINANATSTAGNLASNLNQQAQINANSTSNALSATTNLAQQTGIDANTAGVADNLGSNLTQQTAIDANVVSIASGATSNLAQQVTIDSNVVSIAGNSASNLTQQTSIDTNVLSIASGSASNLNQQTTIDANVVSIASGAASNLVQQTSIDANIVAIASGLASNLSQQTEIDVNIIAIASGLASNLAQQTSIDQNVVDIATGLASNLAQQTTIDANVVDIAAGLASNLEQQVTLNAVAASNLNQQTTIDANVAGVASGAASNLTQQATIDGQVASNLAQQVSVDANASGVTDNLASNLTQQTSINSGTASNLNQQTEIDDLKSGGGATNTLDQVLDAGNFTLKTATFGNTTNLGLFHVGGGIIVTNDNILLTGTDGAKGNLLFNNAAASGNRILVDTTVGNDTQSLNISPANTLSVARAPIIQMFGIDAGGQFRIRGATAEEAIITFSKNSSGAEIGSVAISNNVFQFDSVNTPNTRFSIRHGGDGGLEWNFYASSVGGEFPNGSLTIAHDGGTAGQQTRPGSATNVVLTFNTNGTTDLHGSVQIIGSGTNDLDTSAVLELTSTIQGFLPPRMTTSQRLAIVAPEEGLIVYDLTLTNLFVYNGTQYARLDVESGGGCVMETNTFSVSTNTVSLTFSTIIDPLVNVTLMGGEGGTEFRNDIDDQVVYNLEPQFNRTSGGAEESIMLWYETSIDGGTNWIKGQAIEVELKGGDTEVSPLTVCVNGKEKRIRFRVQGTMDSSLQFVTKAAGSVTSDHPIVPSYLLTID